MIIPPYLKKGDTIGLVCPAGFMPLEKVQTAIDTLQQWGFKVKAGKTVGSESKNYFSGTDDERLDDLQQMMDDKDINAIMCARGGYGMGRIIDDINFNKFKKNPKWIIGFSDITVLHSHLFAKYKIASLHAPMAAAFNDEEYKNEYVQSLFHALVGTETNYKCEAHEFNKVGLAEGRLIGGNLSLLAHLVCTGSDIKTKNKILFIEDIGEYIYNVDRMMYQLKRSGKLDKLAGLVVGKLSDMKDTELPFGQTAEEVIRDVIKEYDYPVCFNFPVSHEKENYALKIGVKYSLNVDAIVSLKEL
ncbi:MAG TPA: LD-carboxypeptidase [Chitinophagaceae bacterium]|nr:LD-carboxypeptidase [Chitinophagaceae bacterium]